MSIPVESFEAGDFDVQDDPDYVDLEHGDDREPMILVSNPGTPASDVRLLMMRLEEHGYDIGLERDGEKTQAYTIRHPGYGGEAGDE